MELKDLNDKVLFISDENKYYYFALINEKNNNIYFGSWDKSDLPKPNRVLLSDIESWKGFIDFTKANNKIDNLKIYNKNKYKKECSIIQKSLIKSLFN